MIHKFTCIYMMWRAQSKKHRCIDTRTLTLHCIPFLCIAFHSIPLHSIPFCYIRWHNTTLCYIAIIHDIRYRFIVSSNYHYCYHYCFLSMIIYCAGDHVFAMPLSSQLTVIDLPNSRSLRLMTSQAACCSLSSRLDRWFWRSSNLHLDCGFLSHDDSFVPSFLG